MPLFGPNVKKMEAQKDIQGLIDLLAHDKPSIRLEAVRALFTIKNFEGLAKAFENDLPSVRSEAASMLGNVDVPEAARLLSQALLHEAEAGLWQQVFDILAEKDLDADEWISIGLKLVEEEKIERGVQCFDRALELNPTQEQISAAGGALMEVGRPREALPYFDRYIAVACDDEQGWSGKGWCLAQIGQLNEALECVNRAMSINSASAWARQLAAMIYVQQEDYEAVCDIEWGTIREHPNYLRAYVTLSEALSRLGKLNSAVEELQRAMEVLHQQEWVKPEDAQNLHIQCGLVYAMKGERELALSHFHEARTGLDDNRSCAMEESYGILVASGLALKGTPKERESRMLTIATMRSGEGYETYAEKVVAEASVEDCIRSEWLSKSDSPHLVTAMLKWWSPAEIEKLAGALTGTGMQVLRTRVDEAMADFVSSKFTE